MKAIDSSAKTTGQANNLAAAGYGAVGVYLRSDRCTAAMIAELHSAGLQVWFYLRKRLPHQRCVFFSGQRRLRWRRGSYLRKIHGATQRNPNLCHGRL